jgi:hypothetical protein
VEDRQLVVGCPNSSRDLVDWGVEGGHTTPEQLRLTVEARREQATKMIESGLSQRQAAKALGVSQSTIRDDVSRKDAQARKNHSTKAERRAEREVELATKHTALPEKRYGVILADPEWRFEPYSRDTGMDRAADNHYPTSATEVIAARPVRQSPPTTAPSVHQRLALRCRGRSRPVGPGLSRGTELSIDDMQASILTPRVAASRPIPTDALGVSASRPQTRSALISKSP